ncbi:hypothetical protein KA005_83900 [bacterium]|nr:hypothetical protein [bacterium]
MDREPIKKTSRIVIASLLCALAAIVSEILFAFFLMVGLDCGEFVVASIRLVYTATILAILAIVWIIIRRKKLKGYVYAILAIILCLPFLYFDYSVRCHVKAREKRKKEWTGLYNLELLSRELIKYTEDNDGYLPMADQWCDLLMGHNSNLTRENFRHPKPELFELNGECHFAFNKNLSGLRLSDVPGDVVLVFEADGDWNLSGTEGLLKTRYRKDGFIRMLFVDQSTKNYWFYKNAVRKFDPKGTYMYYERPRWKP